jgi:hypothetical protein
MDQERVQRHQSLAREAVARLQPYPEGRFAGRGVVICGGGVKYFTCAYVCVNMLRHAGCELPVEIWHLGPFELNEEMRALVAPLGVTCVDAHQVCKEHPARRLNGWELKPYAILHSRFEEVLFLDADNVPLVNPELFFDRPEYRQDGAIFWPDFRPIPRQNPIWAVMEVEYRFEPSFESGQIVVDKRRCWAELQLTMHYNEYSDFYYRLIWGDKDTFHFAWRRLARPYAMVPYHVENLAKCVFNQHDFEGTVVFQHRNHAKWSRDLPANLRIAGFREEERCLEFLRELAGRWNGDPARVPPDSPRAQRLHEEVAASGGFVYHRIGHDRRILRLRSDQGVDGAGREKTWFVRTREDGELELCLVGTHFLICGLERREDGVFTGHWQVFGRMPIELTPLSLLSAEEQLQLLRDERQAALAGRQALLIRVRRDRRQVRFEPDGEISHLGNGGLAAGTWRFCCWNGELALQITEGEGEPCLLYEEPDGIFREAATEGREGAEVIPLD